MKQSTLHLRAIEKFKKSKSAFHHFIFGYLIQNVQSPQEMPVSKALPGGEDVPSELLSSTTNRQQTNEVKSCKTMDFRFFFKY